MFKRIPKIFLVEFIDKVFGALRKPKEKLGKNALVELGLKTEKIVAGSHREFFGNHLKDFLLD